jgi:hypothetical protein
MSEEEANPGGKKLEYGVFSKPKVAFNRLLRSIVKIRHHIGEIFRHGAVLKA